MSNKYKTAEASMLESIVEMVDREIVKKHKGKIKNAESFMEWRKKLLEEICMFEERIKLLCEGKRIRE